MARSDEPDPTTTAAGPAFPLHKEGYTIADYRLVARVGEGTFGEVWKADRGGFPVALKILKASMNSEETQRELKSLETLKKLHHKYLLHTENFWSDGDRLFIEMELAEGGTLKERLKAYQALGKAGIPEDELLKYFTEASKALDYLHGHRPVFLHRDIKPANILLVQGCAKLADFGLLRQVTGDNTSTKTQGGTPVYMAPESIKEDKFSVQTDLFSFAITYAELRQGKLPFTAKNQFQIYQKICQDPPEMSDIFHPEERRVLLKAMAKEPGQRYASCGEFVFELNRVVPWVPAVAVPGLPAPVRPERSAASLAATQTTDEPPAPPVDPGTQRKRPLPTMPDYVLPPGVEPSPSAPTVARDDVTMIHARSAKPAAEPVIEDPAPVQTVKPASAAKMSPGRDTEKKTAPPTQTHVPPHRHAGKRTVLKIVAAAAVLAVVTGIGFLAMGGRNADNGAKDKDAKRDKDVLVKNGTPAEIAAQVDQLLQAGNLNAARELVLQNRQIWPDRGEELDAKIDNKATVHDILGRAEGMLKNKDFDACLQLLAKAKARFENQDLARKDRIKEQARDGGNKKLVAEVYELLKTRDPQQVHDKLEALAKFRQKYPETDWQPKFKELPFPTERLSKTWQALLADKVDVGAARELLDDLKAYANPDQPERFVLDPLYDKNLAALEALVKAHETGQDDAIKSLLAVLRDNQQPGTLSRNLWSALGPLEKARKPFRFKDLELLPAGPDDQAVKQLRTQLYAQVLDRLVQENNHQWLPTDEEAAQCRTWLADFKGPGADVLALKAECLVRGGAKLDEINAIALPVKSDWYVSYVHALVENKNKKYVEAAARLVETVKGNAKIRKERLKGAVAILHFGVSALPRAASRPKEFADDKSALKAIDWLTLMLDLDDGQNQVAVDDLVELACAALQAEPANAELLTKRALDRLDQRGPADQAAGYRSLVKAYRADVDAASANLVKANKDNGLWERASAKSERAQALAYRALNLNFVQEAAELNGDAVEANARALFAKSQASEKAKAKFRVYEEAIQKAEKTAPKKAADGFVLPVTVAALDSAVDFSKDDLETMIGAGEAVLALKLPKVAWVEALHDKATVRLADAKYLLLVRKLIAKEAFNEKEEYPKILSLYEQVKGPAAKSAEKYPGQLNFKIGSLHFLLGKYDRAVEELNQAKKKMAVLNLQNYPEALQAEIRQAIRDTEALLNTKELKSAAGEQ